LLSIKTEVLNMPNTQGNQDKGNKGGGRGFGSMPKEQREDIARKGGESKGKDNK
jgi:general stress protein YciG